jgi:hypothetical protein
MSTSQEGLERGSEAALPSLAQVTSGRGAWSLSELSRQLEKTLATQEVALKPFKPSLPEKLQDFVRLYSARVPDHLDPDGGEVDHILVVAAGEWTQPRVDAFIASMAPLRLKQGFPLFRFYSLKPLAPEIEFLFGTMLAGVFEIMAWELVEEEALHADECADLADAGRRLLRDLYSVELAPHDLQWLSVVNQLIVEELRWFTEDDTVRVTEDIDYVPHAALTLLGCVVGEAIRRNHQGELRWMGVEGPNWPRLGAVGSAMSLPIVDLVFKRFEAGAETDLWEDYEVFHAAGHLSTPVTMAGEVNPLEFLPRWDPLPTQSLAEATEVFDAKCAELGLLVEPHPILPEDALDGFVEAFTCLYAEEAYDLFVCTEPWTEERVRVFMELYGHRSLQDWEVGLSPVFVFFSAHPLPPLLDYCFLSGPPAAPLEGLARVETPSPKIPANNLALENVALWLMDALERYTTIGLRLDAPSVAPGLEFFVREELRQGGDEPEGLGDAPIAPEALLVAVGLAVGANLKLRSPRRCVWTFGEDAQWPQMRIEPEQGEPVLVDWVGQAFAIWRGEADEFKFPAFD